MNMMLLAQAAQPSQTQSTYSMLFMFGAVFLIMYFLMIRPQQKKAKEHEKMLEGLQVNDKVITSSGIIGVITNIKKDKNTIVIRVDDNCRIEFQRSYIVGKLNND